MNTTTNRGPWSEAKQEEAEQIAAVVGPWLLPLVDRYGWGYRTPGGADIANLDNHNLALWRGGKRPWYGPPQSLDRRLFLSHLCGIDTVSYNSSRGSGYALLCLDVDAHKGQADALDAVELLRSLFPGAYFEPSTRGRGYHLYLLVHVGRQRRDRFNALVREFAGAARRLLVEHNVASTIEVKGEFTIYRRTEAGAWEVDHRGSRIKVPRPSSVARARALVDSPIFHPEHLFRFIHLTEDMDAPTPPISDEASAIARQVPVPPHLDPTSAFDRMLIARFQFSRLYRRDPVDEDELNRFYMALWETDEGDEGRLDRARRCLAHSTFDITQATGGGYRTERRRLLEAIRQHVRPEHRTIVRYPYRITDEDLSVVLWVAGQVAFGVSDQPRRQFGMPNARVKAAFTKLRDDGAIDGGGTMRSKVNGMKLILEAAGLIACIDSGYCFEPGNPDAGCGKKYVVGTNHWRRAEWERFAAGLRVSYIAPASRRAKEAA